MGSLSSAWMIVFLAFRNLFSHRIKNLIVGFILAGGTFLLVFFTALLDSVEAAMSRSIISSMAGHIQVYSSDARDELALFGGGFMGEEDLGTIENFRTIREKIEALPNVDAVIPMGIGSAVSTTGNEMDRILTALREAVKVGDQARIAAIRAQVHQVLALLEPDVTNRLAISSDRPKVEKQLADVRRARTEAFWHEFDADTETAITFLESRVAPATPDDKMVWLRYLGTDLHRFAAKFDRFEIVRGTMVPPGKRGFLLNDRYLEDWLKNRVARDLDKLKKDLTNNGERISNDDKLQSRVRRMARQYRQITFELDAEQAATLEARLRTVVPNSSGDLNKLVQDFLTVTDENFQERYDFFYADVAPLIQMYTVPVGGVLTVRAYTRSGYVKSVNVKVYGTFRFKGIESTDFAGGTNLVDLVTFRDLYGQMTDDMRAEASEIRAEIGLAEVGRDDAEAALFGGDADLVADGDSPEGFDEFKGVEISGSAARAALVEERTFSQTAIDDGLALNAAVILKQPELLRATLTEIERLSEAEGLGLKVVDWQAAAGVMGQFITLLRVVLYIAIFVIFIVALVIINNSMIMATMERVTEIGTLRAMGAQRTYVMAMFLLETAVLGVLAGLFGAALGAAAITTLGYVGIPAVHDVLTFLFAGPRLFPAITPGHLVQGMLIILFVSLLSTLYPALIATRISPVIAMQAAE